MKKILYFVSLCLILFPLGSCSRFLEEVSPTSLSEATVYNTPEALESQIFGVYQSLNQNRLWLGSQYEFLQCGSGLITWKSQRTTNEYVDQLRFTKYSTTTECNSNLFSQVYTGVNRCNRLIDNLPASPVEEAYKVEIEAEARLVRAIMYFLAVRLWGDVPLIVHSPQNLSEVHSPRTAWYKVYMQVLEDLEFAQEHMRDKARQEAVNPGKGRPFNMAAAALKSSVYLTIGSLLSSPDDNFWDSSKDATLIAEGKDPRTPDFSPCGIKTAKDAFQLAYDTAKEVMDSGAYSLVGNYFKLFTWTDPEDFALPERILTIQSTDKAGTSFAAVRTLPQNPPYTSNYNTTNNNWGRVRPDRFLINEIIRRTGGVMGTGDYDSEIYVSTEDPRFDASFLHQFTNLKNTVLSCYPHASIMSTNNSTYLPYFRKYSDPSFDVTNGRADCYMLRYAEIYLIRAEAAAMLSDGPGDMLWDEAFDLIEILHARARASFDPRTETAPRSVTFPRWDPDSFTSKEELRDAIVWERLIELTGECHEWFDTHRYGATWLRDNIALPKNAFTELECNEDFYMYAVQMLRPHPETVQDIRKGLLCAFPEPEIRQNTSLTAADQNDFYWQ